MSLNRCFFICCLTIVRHLKLNSEGLIVSISFSGKQVSRALTTIMLVKLSFYGKIYSMQTGLVCKRTNTETLAGMVPALLNYNYEWTCVMEGKRFPPPLTPGIPSRRVHQVKRELRMGSFFWCSQRNGGKELPGTACSGAGAGDQGL